MVGRRGITSILVSGAIAGGAVVAAIVSGGGGGTGLPACTQTFTTANIGTSPYAGNNLNNAVGSGTTSSVFCLAAGTYGELALYGETPSGSGQAMIRPADGATVSAGFNLNGVTKMKITGFKSANSSSSISTILLQNTGLGNDTNVTVQDNTMAGGTAIRDNTATNANILIDNNTYVGFNSVSDETGRMFILLNTGTGITISNNTFGDGHADGIQLASTNGVTISNNEFYNIVQTGCVGHCDAIQDSGGSSNIAITGNYLHGNETGIMAYDGTGSGWTVTDNVLTGTNVDNVINLGGSPSPTVEHNTIVGANKYINFGSKETAQSTNVTARNNITPGGIQSNGAGIAATYTVNNYNMCSSSCTGANSITGSPTFTGGGSPTTFAGFRLSGGSTGKSVASDGLDIGIR